MTIPWNKCSEHMPPDDDRWIIVNREYSGLSIRRGFLINKFDTKEDMDLQQWIFYTEEAWKECCLPDSPDNKL